MGGNTLATNICPSIVLALIFMGLTDQFFRAIATLLEPGSSCLGCSTISIYLEYALMDGSDIVFTHLYCPFTWVFPCITFNSKGSNLTALVSFMSPFTESRLNLVLDCLCLLNCIWVFLLVNNLDTLPPCQLWWSSYSSLTVTKSMSMSIWMVPICRGNLSSYLLSLTTNIRTSLLKAATWGICRCRSTYPR